MHSKIKGILSLSPPTESRTRLTRRIGSSLSSEEKKKKNAANISNANAA